jgi:hypothetical protein
MNFPFNDLTFFGSRIGSTYDPNYPSLFPNMLRWYKADSFNLANGEPVGSGNNAWIDHSIYGDHLTCNSTTVFPTYISNAQNGLPAVSFANQMTGFALTGSGIEVTNDWTIFFIYSGRNTGVNQTLYGDSTAGLFRASYNFNVGTPTNITTEIANPKNLVSISNINPISGQVKFLSFAITGTSGSHINYPITGYPHSLVVNPASTGGVYPTTGFHQRIGYRNNSATYVGFSGYLFELILYNTGMNTNTVHDFLTNYFQPKWNI